MPEMPEQTDASTDQRTSEDAFFILRDCCELFQRRLVEIARQSGISSPTVLEAFSNEIKAAHDQLVSSKQQEGFEQTKGLTASRISLVGHDDLELEIRIGDVANHLRGNDHIGHWRVQLRYMTLLHRPTMLAESNPLGLEPICRGLWAICRESSGGLDQNLDRLDRLEELLQAQLPEVYIELNSLLEQHRIEPAPAQLVQRANVRSASGGSEAGHTNHGCASGGTNALSSLKQALLQSSSGSMGPEGYALDNSAQSTGSITLNAPAMLMLNHLMERLSVLENQQLQGLPNGNPAKDAPLRAIRAKDIDFPLGKPAAIALDTLSLIFEAIFATPDLPDAVKAAIGRLQIPLLKLAILDVSFFTDSQHPARQLVDRMARFAIGLAQDSGREHPTCLSLRKLADAVRTTLEKNEGDLSPHLIELETLINARDHSIQTNAQPYIQIVLKHETHESARSIAQIWLRKTLGKISEPAVAAFLATHWVRVMQAACLDGSTTGARWKESEATIDELIWSVKPKQTAEERKQLLSLIPSLLKRINTGLDQVEISIEERTPFLNACFELQTASLRNRSETPAPPVSEQGITPPLIDPLFPTTGSKTSAPSLQLLESNGTLVRYLGAPTETQSPWRTGSAKAWEEGDWISFLLPDGERLCGRICWHGSTSGTVLLFNADWGFAVVLLPIILAQQLRNGEARIVSEQSIFDEAATQALGQIKPVSLLPQ